MTALTKSRTVVSIPGTIYSLPVAAAKTIYQGALVCVDSSGNATPGATATGLIAYGIARETADNADGDAGDISVDVISGIHGFKNSADSDEITRPGTVCYIVDDQTVAKTSASNTRSVAGYVRLIDGSTVFVELKNTQSADGDLVAANNLSDVASAATARDNIGANRGTIQFEAKDLVGANAKVYRAVAPVALTITKIWSVANGALTTGSATVTGKIGATSITNGALTIASGGAAGDADSATPTANNTASAGDVISFTVSGTNDASVGADIVVEYEF